MKTSKRTTHDIIMFITYIIGIIVCIILISVMVEFIMGEIGTIKTLVGNVL